MIQQKELSPGTSALSSQRRTLIPDSTKLAGGDVHTIPVRRRSLLSLLRGIRGPWLCLVLLNRVQHDLDRVLRCIGLVASAPVVANSVRKNTANPVECSSRNGSPNMGVPLKTMLGILVPVYRFHSLVSILACSMEIEAILTRSGMFHQTQQ